MEEQRHEGMGVLLKPCLTDVCMTLKQERWEVGW